MNLPGSLSWPESGFMSRGEDTHSSFVGLPEILSSSASLPSPPLPSLPFLILFLFPILMDKAWPTILGYANEEEIYGDLIL